MIDAPKRCPYKGVELQEANLESQGIAVHPKAKGYSR